jgi:GAF domain-containing protein
MRNSHPQAYEEGIKALAVFPLQVNCQKGEFCQPSLCQEEGVLYIGFREKPEFTEQELKSLGVLFANRASDAIRHVMIYKQMRERTHQLATLHSVTQSLAHISKKDLLLHHIAWDTLNILAADVVTIYEYIQIEKHFVVPPQIAGRLKAKAEMQSQIDSVNVPFQLLESGENVYEKELVLDRKTIFSDSPFAERESIKSVAGVLLKVANEIVGVMFINYRRLHYFSDEERKLIETLASSAAIAIKNQRWLTARSEIDRKLITTLDRNELLNLIVGQAVTLTGADLGTIRLLDPDPSQEMLVTQAKYPKDAVIDESRIRTSINEGITGWVAKHRKSALVDDVESDQWKEYYQASFPNIRSELCVPLLDKDGHLLGVLNVESHQKSAFDEKHQQMLEALADQAVIGIQNIKNKQQLVNMETLINLGDLATSLLHKMKNKIGVIREFSQDIIDRGDMASCELANLILSNADQLRQETKRLKSWTEEKPQHINIAEVVNLALCDIKIPTNVEKHIDLPMNLPQVLAGQQQLLNVFSNLIQNAVDAMCDGGKLSIYSNIWTRDKSVWIQVKVSDNGVGIAQENLKNIFYIDHTTKSKGTGYGLWWTKFYIQRLEGDISVSSQLNQGSEFTIILPCCQLDR